jgi:hypothetical protein
MTWAFQPAASQLPPLSSHGKRHRASRLPRRSQPRSVAIPALLRPPTGGPWQATLASPQSLRPPRPPLPSHSRPRLSNGPRPPRRRPPRSTGIGMISPKNSPAARGCGTTTSRLHRPLPPQWRPESDRRAKPSGRRVNRSGQRANLAHRRTVQSSTASSPAFRKPTARCVNVTPTTSSPQRKIGLPPKVARERATMIGHAGVAAAAVAAEGGPARAAKTVAATTPH